MKSIVYVMAPIQGISEHSHPPVRTEVARAKLEATMQYLAVEPQLAHSFTIASDRDFGFPDGKPKVDPSFFGDLTPAEAEKEFTALYDQSLEEIVNTLRDNQARLDKADLAELQSMFDEFYPISDRDIRHLGYVFNDDLIGLFNSVSIKDLCSIYNEECDYTRHRIAGLLETMDSIEIRLYARAKQVYQKLLDSYPESREEVLAVMRKLIQRGTNSHFSSVCGVQAQHGAGYWIARLVLNPNPPSEFDGKPNDLIKNLTGWKLDYFAVDL